MMSHLKIGGGIQSFRLEVVRPPITAAVRQMTKELVRGHPPAVVDIPGFTAVAIMSVRRNSALSEPLFGEQFFENGTADEGLFDVDSSAVQYKPRRSL